MITKTSIGIILVNLGNVNYSSEVLLVHKRYTYEFNEFVNGNYIYLHNDPSKFFIKKKYTIMSVEALLEHMTTDELLDIMSLNFEQMWYRICLNVDKEDPFYIKKFNKFKTEFLDYDNGKKLINMIKNTKFRGTLLWEIPKGRKVNNKESDIDCAIREVEEETGIKKEDYKIIPNIKKKVSYISNNVKYVFIYFIGIINNTFMKRRASANIYQRQSLLKDIREISDIGWFNMQYIKLFDNGNNQLEYVIKPSIKIVKNFVKYSIR
jgi:ADP-ribose pyrophosphatase YjhB (NUDIX family)